MLAKISIKMKNKSIIKSFKFKSSFEKKILQKKKNIFNNNNNKKTIFFLYNY